MYSDSEKSKLELFVLYLSGNQFFVASENDYFVFKFMYVAQNPSQSFVSLLLHLFVWIRNNVLIELQV